MRRIRRHGQVRELVNDRDGRNIKSVASIGFERANSALAQDDIVVSTSHNVFGGEQQLFQCRSNAPFEQNRLFDFPQFTQQIEILHVARANLEDVHKRQHDGYLRNLHDLADDQQFKAITGLAQKFQSFQPESLERVRRTARLESASTKRPRARLRHALSCGEKLLARFHGTRTCDHHHLLASDFQPVGKFDDSARRAETSSRQLVGRANPVNVFDS